jgi:hypothetical protein
MPGLNYDDTKYYAEKFCPKDKNVKDYTRDLLTRGYAEFMYELIGTDYVKEIWKRPADGYQ